VKRALSLFKNVAVNYRGIILQKNTMGNAAECGKNRGGDSSIGESKLKIDGKVNIFGILIIIIKRKNS